MTPGLKRNEPRSSGKQPPRMRSPALQAPRQRICARSRRESRSFSGLGRARPPAIELRTREHDLAALLARLTSLEELDVARAHYGDGARTILAEAAREIAHMGSVADYLEVDRRHERAVEACLGEALQHVVVPLTNRAAAACAWTASATRAESGS